MSTMANIELHIYSEAILFTVRQYTTHTHTHTHAHTHKENTYRGSLSNQIISTLKSSNSLTIWFCVIREKIING